MRENFKITNLYFLFQKRLTRSNEKFNLCLRMSPKKNPSTQAAKKEAPELDPVPSRLDESGEVKKQNRISLAMDDSDLGFDFSSMRPATKAKFAQAVQRDLPNILREGGIAPAEESTGVVAGGFTDENVKTALDLCTSLSAFGASFLAGRFIKNPYTGKPLAFDGDIMRDTFVLTEKQHAELDPRGKRLANRYLPKTILDNSDLAMFFGMWFTYLGENSKIAIKLQVERETQKAAAGAQVAAERTARQPQGDTDAPKPNGKVYRPIESTPQRYDIPPEEATA